jgi:hypothetical protein
MKLAALLSTVTLIGTASLASVPSYAESAPPLQNAVASPASSAMAKKMPTNKRKAVGEEVSTTTGSEGPPPPRSDIK